MMSSFISRNTNTNLSSVDRQNHQIHNNFLAEDHRTLQLALELSLVGLNDAATGRLCSSAQIPVSAADIHNRSNNATVHELNYPQHVKAKQEDLNSKFESCSLNFINSPASTAQNGSTEHIGSCGAGNVSNTNESNNTAVSKFFTSNSLLTTAIDDRSKKSQNMTECVPVPSSEHVAEIVGRQGCKIKALRAKTNTYIKTPVRGEEPVFVVTGRKEDVTKAKREILSAAEHFSLIRATRKSSGGNTLGALENNDNNEKSFVTNTFAKIPSRPSSMPGHVTIQVRVPYRVVGLVVGPKGTTIKHIQHQTQTYIITPSREKEPIFEVTGLPNNVQSARKQIEAHIALRTGSLRTPDGSSDSSVILADSSNDVPAVHNLNVLSKMLNDPTIDSDTLLSLCKENSIRSTPGYKYEACAVPTKEVYVNESQSPNGYRKNDFNISRLEQEFAENQLNFLHPDNFQFQYFNTSNQTHDYMNDLAENVNIKATSQSSYFLADLDSTLKVQKKKELLYPSLQPTFTINHNLKTSSLTSMKQKRSFRSDSNVSSYMQINFSNNDTIDYKPIRATTGSADIQNCSITSQNNNNSSLMTRSCSSASSTASSRSANNSGSCSSSRPEFINIWTNFGESLDLDEGFGELPNIWTLPSQLSALKSSNSSPSTSISPTDSFAAEILTHTHNFKVGLNSSESETHHGCKANKSLLQKNHFRKEGVMRTLLKNTMTPRHECLGCNHNKVNAVLVPCGHAMLCIECANRICELDNGICPICSINVYHASRVII